jgi:hypothetical protein
MSALGIRKGVPPPNLWNDPRVQQITKNLLAK